MSETSLAITERRAPSAERSESPSTPAARARKNLIARLASAANLNLVTPGDLTIERRRGGDAFIYCRNGKQIVDKPTKRRLDRLAVPPAYISVFYASDPRAHIQAVGTDAAGRLQYRYHADWTDVREALKARRLAHLVEALPDVRRTTAQDLEAPSSGRRYALAAAVRLIERTAIRAGNQAYEKISGSRGAATLCKTNVGFRKNKITLQFRGKGKKDVRRSFDDALLAEALKGLVRLPGKRLFQYESEGDIRAISTSDLNAYLREAAGRVISVKDFRTLIASSAAVEMLSTMEPGKTERRRRSQILQAVRTVADELANTPAVARKSYIHASIIDAFEQGKLTKLRRRLRAKPFSPRRERLLLSVVRAAASA